MVHCVQALQLAIDAGNAEEVLPLARSLHQELPDRFAPVVAAGAAASGNADEAAAMLDIHARDRFAGLPQDLSWLYSLAMYATAAQLIGDEKVSLTIADLLSPWADHFLVLGSGALCLGSISGYVASALMGAGEPGRAESFARNAVVQNERTGCVPAAHWARTLLETVGGKEPSR
jgi:hypothetical protein